MWLVAAVLERAEDYMNACCFYYRCYYCRLQT